MNISEAQKKIRDSFGEKDQSRGVEGTFMYLVEEIGELSTAIREETLEEVSAECADVLAWLLSVCQLKGVDLEEAFKKKYAFCPGCGKIPCQCKTKP